MFSNSLTFLIFLLIGLELRDGISKPKSLILPSLCALGGMAAPALIFKTLQPNSPIWAVTMPTDVALALGALSLLGPRVNPRVRIFLLMLAVADDFFSLGVIAIFFRSDLHLSSVIYTFGAATIGFFSPKRDQLLAPFAKLVTFAVIPAYIILNLFSKLDFASISQSGTWAIVIARVAGKILGITLVAWAIFKVAPRFRPEGIELGDIAGVGALAGMGLTVSLVIAKITVTTESALSEARLGLFFAALISGAIGTLVLKRSLAS